MNLAVTPAAPDEQPIVAALFELYAYDFSELLGLDVRDDGHFPPRPLDAWWSDARRHPFLFRADGKLAGFALVHRRSRLSGDESITDMDQFFVLRKYRRRGVGLEASRTLFEKFRGRWEVRQEPPNRAATEFWRRAIGRFTDGKFEEQLLNDERWHGPVQFFDSTQR